MEANGDVDARVHIFGATALRRVVDWGFTKLFNISAHQHRFLH